MADGLLGRPATPSLVATFRAFSQEVDPQLRSLGVIGLIEHGAPDALALVPQDAQALKQLALRAELAGAIRNLRDTSAVTVVTLGQLATADDVAYGIRLAAAEALRGIHTKDCLAFLAVLLDSPDAELRNRAFGGFSMFVSNLPVYSSATVPGFSWVVPQGPAPHRTPTTDQHAGQLGVPLDRHSEYSAFWKQWWSQTKDQLK